MTRILAAVCIACALTFPARAQSIHDLSDQEIGLSEPSITGLGKTTEAVWTSSPFLRDATGVVVEGRSNDRNLRGWVRFTMTDGAAELWRQLYVVFSATSETFFGGYYGGDVFSGGRFEVRFVADADVSLQAAGVFDNRLDEDARLDRTSIRPAPGKAGSAVRPPEMISRSEWGASGFRGTPEPLARPNYLYITFHHAAGFGAHTREEGIEQVFAIQDFHQNGRGWSDIGYQFVMDQNGRLYQGRPFLNGPAPLASIPPLALGAHAGGANTGNIGVCVLGCYHPPYLPTCDDVMTPSARDSLVTMFAFLAESYNVSPSNLRGHRDFGETSCPGDNNYVLLDELIDETRLLLITGNAPLGTAELVSQADDAGVVHLSWRILTDSGIERIRVEREYLGRSTVIFEGDGALPDSLIDDRTTAPGPVVYRLFAIGADGRQQMLAVAQALVENPEEYVITENFPNPFARSTLIRYFLPRDGIVRLDVFDVLGRAVARLVNGHQDGGSWYHAEFDASGLPDGTYFYRLSVEGFAGTDFKETRTLVLVR